jgi:peptidyl-prolyl cis-trans isomerase D
MALIGTIRKHSALAVILIGVAIAAFILSDLLTGPGGSRGNRLPVIGEVAGTDIKAVDYNNRVEENIEIQKLNQNVEALSPQETYNIRVSTWNQYLNEIIMGEEYEKLSLDVTTEELFDLVQGPRPHRLIMQYFVDPNTGSYNPQLVTNFLQNLNRMQPDARMQWRNLEKFIKEDRIATKYNTLVAKAYYVPDAFAKIDFEHKRKAAESRYTAIRFTSIGDSLVSITDNDFEKYYEENKYLYTQDASRDIDYVIYSVEPSPEDRQNARDDFYSLYEEFQDASDIPSFVNSTSDFRYDSTWKKREDLSATIDSLIFNSPVGTIVPPYEEDGAWHMAKLMEVENRPDSMKAEHILIAYAGAFRAAQDLTRTKISAESLADSLLQVVERNRSRLPELATEFSDDGSVVENQGDLGWFADGTMVYPFNRAVADGRIGDVVKVETQFGYHIIHITGKKDIVKKVRVAMVDRSIEPSSKTFQDIYTQASTFSGENNTLEKFNQAVETQGLDKRSATYLSVMANNIAGITFPREVIRWAYYDGIELGEVSPVFDVGDAYVVAVLTAIREDGTIPFEQMKENLRTFVMNDKKAEYIQERIGGNRDIYSIAQDFGTQVDTNISLTFSSRNVPGFGSEFQVIGHIFGMEAGQTSEPVKGNGAVFVVAVDNFYTPPDENAYLDNRTQMVNGFRTRLSTGNVVYTALEKKADIVDNRELFF